MNPKCQALKAQTIKLYHLEYAHLVSDTEIDKLIGSTGEKILGRTSGWCPLNIERWNLMFDQSQT